MERNRFSNYLGQVIRDLQNFYDLTPTHYNERRELIDALTYLNRLESLLKNQQEPLEVNE